METLLEVTFPRVDDDSVLQVVLVIKSSTPELQYSFAKLFGVYYVWAQVSRDSKSFHRVGDQPCEQPLLPGYESG